MEHTDKALFLCTIAQNVSILEAENGWRQEGRDFMLDKTSVQTGYISGEGYKCT
jgi:hypothetical protein